MRRGVRLGGVLLLGIGQGCPGTTSCPTSAITCGGDGCPQMPTAPGDPLWAEDQGCPWRRCEPSGVVFLDHATDDGVERLWFLRTGAIVRYDADLGGTASCEGARVDCDVTYRDDSLCEWGE